MFEVFLLIDGCMISIMFIDSILVDEMGGYDMTQGNSWNNNDFGGMF